MPEPARPVARRCRRRQRRSSRTRRGSGRRAAGSGVRRVPAERDRDHRQPRRCADAVILAGIGRRRRRPPLDRRHPRSALARASPRERRTLRPVYLVRDRAGAPARRRGRATRSASRAVLGRLGALPDLVRRRAPHVPRRCPPQPLRPLRGGEAAPLARRGDPTSRRARGRAPRPVARDRLPARRAGTLGRRARARGRDACRLADALGDDESSAAGEIAALVHDPALDDEPDLVALIAAGAAFRSRTCGSRPSSARSSSSSRPSPTRHRACSSSSIDGRPDPEPEPGHRRSERSRRRGAISAASTSGTSSSTSRSGRRCRRASTRRRRTSRPRVREQFTNAAGERRVIEWRSAPVPDAAGRVIEHRRRRYRHHRAQAARGAAAAGARHHRDADAGDPEPRRRRRQRRPDRRRRRRRDAGRRQQRVPRGARLAGRARSCGAACWT